MAKAHNIQSYLSSKKVGPLFEEMMNKLVSDMPDEPIYCLIQFLQRKWDKKNATCDINPPMPTVYGDTSLSVLGKHTGFENVTSDKKKNPSGLWSGTPNEDSLVGKKGRDTGYDKPWRNNSRKVSAKVSTSQSQHIPSKKEKFRREWNNENKIVAKSFDELDAFGDIDRKLSSWQEVPSNEEQDFLGVKKRVRHKKEFENMDELLAAEEFTMLPRQLSDNDLELDKSKASAKRPVSAKTARSNKQLARRTEAAIEAKKAQVSSPDVRTHNSHSDEEVAFEAFEDEALLMDEGVHVDNKRRHHSRQKRRSTTEDQDQGSSFKVTICARCAILISSLESGRLGTNAKTVATDIEPLTNRFVVPQKSTFNAAAGDIDTFESVSQVDGPRFPIWNDSDDDSDFVKDTPRAVPSHRLFTTAGSVPSPPSYRTASAALQQETFAPSNSGNFHSQNDSQIRIVPADDAASLSELSRASTRPWKFQTTDDDSDSTFEPVGTAKPVSKRSSSRTGNHHQVHVRYRPTTSEFSPTQSLLDDSDGAGKARSYHSTHRDTARAKSTPESRWKHMY